VEKHARNSHDRYGSGPRRDPKVPSFHIPDTTKPEVVVTVTGLVVVTVRRPEVPRIVDEGAAPDAQGRPPGPNANPERSRSRLTGEAFADRGAVRARKVFDFGEKPEGEVVGL